MNAADPIVSAQGDCGINGRTKPCRSLGVAVNESEEKRTDPKKISIVSDNSVISQSLILTKSNKYEITGDSATLTVDNIAGSILSYKSCDISYLTISFSYAPFDNLF